MLLLADMTVDLVKPPTPSTVETTSSGDPSEPESDDDKEAVTVSDTETPSVKELSDKVRQLEAIIAKGREGISSTEKQLAYLERWGSALTTEKTPPNAQAEGVEFRSTAAVSVFISTYSESRSGLSAEKAKLTEEIRVAEKELAKAKKEKAKQVSRLLNKKKKAKEERLRKKEEERERLREEGIEDKKKSGEPDKWYRVRVWIERTDEDIAADRRGKQSVDADEDAELELTYSKSYLRPDI